MQAEKNKEVKKIILIFIIFGLNSCGLFQVANGYDKYVRKNENGRKELVNKKFKDKFKSEMINGFDLKTVYRNFYQDKLNSYKRYSYLRFFKDGQYACFVGENDNVDLNQLEKANHVGYYIIDDGILKLETPTGNFNTSSFRVINKYKIEDNKLLQIKSDRGNLVYEKHEMDSPILNEKANW